MFSFRVSALSCFRAFGDLCGALRSSAQENEIFLYSDKIQNAHDRFRLWSNNLGVLQVGKASLDSRLRDASVMHEHIEKLLLKLQSTLEQGKRDMGLLKLT